MSRVSVFPEKQCIWLKEAREMKTRVHPLKFESYHNQSGEASKGGANHRPSDENTRAHQIATWREADKRKRRQVLQFESFLDRLCLPRGGRGGRAAGAARQNRQLGNSAAMSDDEGA